MPIKEKRLTMIKEERQILVMMMEREERPTTIKEKRLKMIKEERLTMIKEERQKVIKEERSSIKRKERRKRSNTPTPYGIALN